MINSNVRLSDLQNNAIPLHFVTDEQSFFVQSFQKFSITLIDPIDGNMLYSVVPDLEPIDPNKPYQITSHPSTLSDNSSYTIFFNENQTVQVDVTGETDNVTVSYFITYKPENTLEKEQLYNDLITNNNLPTLEELLPCLLDSTNKKDILQRMLLDFKRIVNTKGTKETVIKFLEFMSFGVEGQFSIFDEYFSRVLKTTTIVPDKEVDTKTGDYWAEYDNYTTPEHNKFTSKNLPNRLIDNTDLEEFWLKLERAIALANVYFTLPEQSINRWHLNNSVNIPVFQSLTSNNHLNSNTNPHTFYKDIHIYMWNLVNSESVARYLVSNNLLVNDKFGNGEVRYFNSESFPPPTNGELFLIENEISDDTDLSFIPQDEVGNIKSEFANITYLTVDLITSEDTWIEYTIEEVMNPLTQIHQPRFKFESDKLEVRFLSKNLGEFRITIDVFNGLGSRERFTYLLNKTVDVVLVEFDILTSLDMNLEDKNDLNLDIESTTTVTTESASYVLAPIDVPEDLREYYNVVPTEPTTYNHETSLYVLPKNNGNLVMNKLTDMPLGLLDSFINLITFKYNPLYTLKIRVNNPLTGDDEIYDYDDEIVYQTVPDILFITSIDTYEQPTDVETVPYIYITTREVGVDLAPSLFDLVLVNNDDPTIIKSVYTLKSDSSEWKFIHNKNKPLNHDTLLFHQGSTISDVFVDYPTISLENQPTETPTLLLKSTFPRLKKLESVETPMFKLDDVLVCNLPQIYVVDAFNIKWQLYNSFNGELVFETKEKALKYRIAENIIYDVVVEFEIRGTDSYVVRKQNKISSFSL